MKTKVQLFLIFFLLSLICSANTRDSIPIDNSNILPSKIELIVPDKKNDKSLSDIIKEWILVLSGAGTLITLSIGGWKSLAEYRLKIQAENRLTESSRIEADINLLKYFTDIMDIAHARKRIELSEKTIEKLFENQLIKADNNTDFKKLNKDIEDAAIFTFPVGAAAQDAAIASIAELAIKHEVLRRPAKQALESIKSFKPELAIKYIEEIDNKTKA